MSKNHEKAMKELQNTREAAKEIWGILEELEKKIKEHKIGGYVRVSISEDGYIDLELGDTEWSVKRYSSDEEPKMYFDWREPVFPMN